jgi:nucleoside-diphosphate-sugar epimerase
VTTISAVTGGSGFVGSHLVERLRAEGHEVVALARSAAARRALEGLGARVVEGDLQDDGALAQLCGGAEVVFHVAGVLAARSAAELLRVNGHGAARVAAAARAAGARRLVLVSSLSVTGPTRPGQPLTESGEPAPVTPYGASKAAGEQAVLASGVAFTIVRPPAVYGPRDREFLRLFRLARRGLVPLPGGGAQELSLVHAADLAAALVAASRSRACQGGVYHAAGPERVTQRDLAGLVGAAVGRRPRLLPLPHRLVWLTLAACGLAARLRGRATLLAPDKLPELLAPAWTCSSAALERDAGWRAAIPLAEGLRATAEWYRREGWL